MSWPASPASLPGLGRRRPCRLKENPAYAAKWLEGIETAIRGLETLPEAHGLAPESRVFERDIRQLLFSGAKRWRVFFVIDGATVRVLHVRHASRDYWRP